MNELAFVQPPLIPVAGQVSAFPATPTAAGVCLTRYSELPTIPGVYFIRLKKDGRTYVGSAKLGTRNLGVRGRIASHVTLLKYGHHHNAHLQNAFRKYGCEAFDCGVLFAGCSLPKCLECSENYFITTFRNRNLGFNIAEKANMPSSVPWTRERRLKISKSLKITYSEKSQRGIDLRAGLSKMFKGHVRGSHSEARKQAVSERLKKEYAAGRNSPFKNKTVEFKEKAKKALKEMFKTLRNDKDWMAKRLGQLSACKSNAKEGFVRYRIRNGFVSRDEKLSAFKCSVCKSPWPTHKPFPLEHSPSTCSRECFDDALMVGKAIQKLNNIAKHIEEWRCKWCGKKWESFIPPSDSRKACCSDNCSYSLAEFGRALKRENRLNFHPAGR